MSDSRKDDALSKQAEVCGWDVSRRSEMARAKPTPSESRPPQSRRRACKFSNQNISSSSVYCPLFSFLHSVPSLTETMEPASSRIFVRGLPPTMNEVDFKKHFGKFEVTDARLFPQRRIGYVGYKSPEDAQKAVRYFNRTFIRMSKIGVELARPVCRLPFLHLSPSFLFLLTVLPDR
jgi:RNA recognition motif-containing protein